VDWNPNVLKPHFSNLVIQSNFLLFGKHTWEMYFWVFKPSNYSNHFLDSFSLGGLEIQDLTLTRIIIQHSTALVIQLKQMSFHL